MDKWLLVASGVIAAGAAIAIVIGRAREASKAEQMVATLIQSASRPVNGSVDFDSFSELPPPVAHYFRHVLTDGQKADQKGEDAPVRYAAKQCNDRQMVVIHCKPTRCPTCNRLRLECQGRNAFRHTCTAHG